MNRQDAKDAKLEKEEPSSDVDALCHQVIGAAIEVHRLLGPGFLESVYEEALCIELSLRGIRFARQMPVGVTYKGKTAGEARLDLLVDERLVVELEAVETLAPIHVARSSGHLVLEGDEAHAGPADRIQRHGAPARNQARHSDPIKSWRSWRLGGLSSSARSRFVPLFSREPLAPYAAR